MAAFHSLALITATFLLLSLAFQSLAITPSRKLILVKEQPLVLKYHNGPLLKGNYTLNLIWYGDFSPAQRAIVVDFFRSLTPSATSKISPPPSPSVSSWWSTTEKYKAGPTTLSVGRQVLHNGYTLGKSLTSSHVLSLASAGPHRGAINVVLTAADVAVDGFCMSSCGTHGSGWAGKRGKSRFAYIWVGNSASQCPGQCAWPFHQPIYGPQTPPLVAPNGDVGVDGMVINLASLLAGTATNPFGDGYFQGSKDAPLEAASACPGMYGKGAYPGYPGNLLVDPSTGASYNANGAYGRKYLLPALYDPSTSSCWTPV